MKKEKNVYVIGNFKGGVGKSTVAKMLGFVSATYYNRKTLIVDLDMQGNTSTAMKLTHDLYSDEELEYDKTIDDVLRKGEPIDNAIYNIIPNLDIIPADILFENYSEFIVSKFQNEIDRYEYIKSILSDKFAEYDAVYLDVPPSVSIYSKSAMYLADYAVIVLQTQVMSMQNAQQYLDYIEIFTEKTNTDIKVLGVLPFMLNSSDSVDTEMYSLAKEMYGKFLLKTVVLKNARLKRYDATGITTDRTKTGKIMMWDKKTHEIFKDILDELDSNKSWYED